MYCQRFPMKITLLWQSENLKDRRLSMLRCIHNLFFPMASYMWYFLELLHLTASLIEGHRQRVEKNIGW
jgi:hypothetical protein